MNTKLSHTNYDANISILDPLQLERYNGRVNIIEPVNPDARFQIFEKTVNKQKTTSYHDATLGIWETSSLSQVFFSAANIQIIQNGLRAGVYELSKQKYVIPTQNEDTLKLIMRAIFLQYAKFLPTGVTEQVERLNKEVLNFAVPSVYGESQGYLKYLQDQSTLVLPLRLPLQHDRVYKQLQQKPWF